MPKSTGLSGSYSPPKKSVNESALLQSVVGPIMRRFFTFTLDADRRLITVSGNLYDILGYTPDQFIQLFPHFFRENQSVRKPHAHSWLSHLGSFPSTYTVQVQDKSGSTHSLEVVEPDSAADSDEVEGMACDVTMETNLMASLEASEAHFREFVDSLPEIVIEYDRKLDLTFVNRDARKKFGITSEELATGISLLNFVAPEDHYKLRMKAESVFRGESLINDEYKAVTRRGNTLRVTSYVTPIFNGSEVVGARGIVIDITEQKSTEQRMMRLATAVDQSAEAIVITDTKGTIEYVNPAFSRITGYSSEEAIGENPRLLKSGKQDASFYRYLWRTISQGRVWNGRLINKKKDGHFIEEAATISPVRDSEGKIINYVSVMRDMTELVAIESQLRQAQKLEAVGALAAGIAHEINTPIQFVGDNTRFLSDSFNALLQLMETGATLARATRDSGEGLATSQRFLDEVESVDLEYLRKEIPKAIEQTLQGVQRVSTIVRAMKDFSHPDKGEKTSLDINKALETTLTVARNELKYVSEVKTEYAEDLPEVDCHAGEINQVFLNLLVNAAHAIADKVGNDGREKGVITVRTRQLGEQVIIEISDTGTGIRQEIHDRVFDPFFTTKAVGKGTGQGLAVARSVVVDKHGGELTFETEVGKGTTFFVRLPIHSEPESQV